MIGDGFALTADHIAYEPKGSKKSPVVGTTLNIVADYRSYQELYLAKVKEFIAINNAFPTADQTRTQIENQLYASDSVVVRHAGSVGSDGAGLFVSLDGDGFTSFRGYLGTDAHLDRDGQNSGRVTGSTLSTSETTFVFSVTANPDPNKPGDSGGAYLIVADGREYVVGTQSSNGLGGAIGTKFTYAGWLRLSDLVISRETGNITRNDPTNMAAGTNSGDSLAGSGRADIMLGRGGNDQLSGGDKVILGAATIAAGGLAGGQVWADDQLFGGSGDDEFTAGMGRDLYHGGDRAAAGVVITAIGEDGTDAVSFAGLTSADADKGIVIHVRDTATAPPKFQSYSQVDGFANGVFVEDLGRDQTVDTLLSIEKIVGTSADDTLRIDEFLVNKLAGVDGQGGLVEIDLGDQYSTPYDPITGNWVPYGDTIDMSRSTEGARFEWSNEQILISVARSTGEADRTLKVKDAETLKASQGDDTIIVTASDVFVSGDRGNDVIDATGSSGTSVRWSKGDGLDTIKADYGSVDIGTLNLGNYEQAIDTLTRHGDVSIKMTDLSINRAELVLRNPILTDSRDESGISSDRYLYVSEILILDKATGQGISFGKCLILSQFRPLEQNQCDIDVWMPSASFSDGMLQFFVSDMCVGVSVRIDNGAAAPSSVASSVAAGDRDVACGCHSWQHEASGHTLGWEASSQWIAVHESCALV